MEPRVRDSRSPTRRWRIRSISRPLCARTRATASACSWRRTWISAPFMAFGFLTMPRSEAAVQLTYLMRPLAEWLDDPETEELCINHPEEAFIRQRGQFRREAIPLTLADLEDIAILAG